jgi:sugar lactone lactonase YvrE
VERDILARMRRGWRAWAATGAACAFAAGASPAVAQTPAPLSVRLFARVPSPGQPEGIVVAHDGTVYAGTDTRPLPDRPDGTPPSKIFAFSPTGALLRDYTIQGENLGGFYGLFGLALDGDGVLYAVEHDPPEIIALDPRTGAQRVYATFPDVPACRAVGRTTDCSDTAADQKPFPNFAVFAPDGTMYVTDTVQALIWRVPRGGGQAKVWLTDAGFEGIPFGPDGAQFEADGRTLVFVLAMPSATRGAGLYTVRVGDDGRPGAVRQLWSAQPADGPDGFQIARSGRIYATAGGHGQIAVLNPDGSELARVPAPGSSQSDPPFDAPANIAFLGNDALITNHAFVVFAPTHWAILDLYAGEPGLPFFLPSLRHGSTGTTAHGRKKRRSHRHRQRRGGRRR